MILRPGPDVRRGDLLAAAFHNYPVDDAFVSCVIPVFRPDGAAIIHAEGALCPLRVDDDAAAMLEVITDVVPAIAGGDLAPIAPAAPGSRCTYLQSRRLIRYDFAGRTTQVVRMVRGDNVVVAGSWLSEQEQRIAVQVEDTSRYDDGGLVLHRVEVFDVASGARVGAVPLPRPRAAGLGWAAGAGLVAVAARGAVKVFDTGLTGLADHPLARAALRCLTEVGATELHALRIHPCERIAVLVAVTGEVMGVRDFAVWRVTWDDADPQVRLLATLHAVGDVAPGSFPPGHDVVDLRVESGGVTRLLIAVGARELHDLGPSRGLQGACWSGPPLRYLAFERPNAQIVMWRVPDAQP